MSIQTAGDVASAGLPKLTEAALQVAGWQSLREAAERIDDILAMAGEWDAGRLPLFEVRKLCSPQERFLVARSVLPHPPAFDRMLQALIDTTEHPDFGATYTTKHGTYNQADLQAAKARYAPDAELGFRIEFPFRQPWRVKPDKDKREPGERGDPVFVTGAKQRRRVMNDEEAGLKRDDEARKRRFDEV